VAVEVVVVVVVAVVAKWVDLVGVLWAPVEARSELDALVSDLLVD
jgi:hypothetical protein